jgi:hypothetical protein
MKHLLLNAKHEIETLRRRNEILQAQADVVAAFSAALFGPRGQQGMSIDVVWELQKAVAEIEARPVQPVPEPEAA